jgi:hypothetical protein
VRPVLGVSVLRCEVCTDDPVRTVPRAPMAPVNPPGNHPIAAPITVVINGPIALMTILSGDGSAIFSPGVSATYTAGVCGELWASSACTASKQPVS